MYAHSFSNVVHTVDNQWAYISSKFLWMDYNGNFNFNEVLKLNAAEAQGEFHVSLTKNFHYDPPLGHRISLANTTPDQLISVL